jgi:protoheme IX farnesyltransferase
VRAMRRLREVEELPVGRAGGQVARAASLPRGWVAQLRDHVSLAKPGIVLLLLVTGYASMVVAQGGVPPAATVLATLLGLALTGGGANAINMWYDQDIDAIMARTRQRPIPAGRMPAERALWVGAAAIAAGTALLDLAVNPLTAALALGGAAYYVLVYTVWLKRRTPQNIVIGGAAGAFPPLVGWAAVKGHLAWAPLLMFLVVFLWTPTHFWSLALYRQEDYRRARIPMMPVVRGELSTKRQSVAYAILTLAASLGLYATGAVGAVYLAVAAVAGVAFTIVAYLSYRERLPETRWARGTFRFSLLYLAVVFAAMVLDTPGLWTAFAHGP